jgi:hypothetical protein
MMMNEASGNFELFEPTSPEVLVPDAWIEPWMVGVALVLVAAAIAVYLYRKRKKTTVEDPQAARLAAFESAKTQLDEIRTTNTREAAVMASLILRKYLSTAAADPALFETHEETISRHEALQGFSDEAKSAATHGFSNLAALKYAPEIPDVAVERVIVDSRTLLATLHQGFMP